MKLKVEDILTYYNMLSNYNQRANAKFNYVISKIKKILKE